MKNSKQYNFIERVIRWYQALLSPDHGIFTGAYGNSRCRFYPTCSEYALESVRQYGLMRGSVVGLKRIAKCHPLNRGGYDPVR